MSHSTTVGGLILKVYQGKGSFWEVSISGPPALDEQSAKNLAEQLAKQILGKDPGNIIWIQT
jgi:hypothetical protein